MIDLYIANKTAEMIAKNKEAPDLGIDFDAQTQKYKEHLDKYTGLTVEVMPKTELLSRVEWAQTNIENMTHIFNKISDIMPKTEDKSVKAKKSNKTSDKNSSQVVSLLAEAVNIAGPSAQIGMLFGYMSKRVLGQVEPVLMQANENDLRLFFVSENLDMAWQKMEVDKDSFINWVILHELTHVYQFAGVSWLKPYLAGLMDSYLDSASNTVSKKMVPDLEQISEFFKDQNIMALVQNKEQRNILASIQAVMAVIEGYAEHTMDAIGETVLDEYVGLRDAMEKRRSQNNSPINKLLTKLLGMDMKMKQYEQGKVFCDYVVDKTNIETLNLVWKNSENMPSLVEMQNPQQWLDRIVDVTEKTNQSEDAIASVKVENEVAKNVTQDSIMTNSNQTTEIKTELNLNDLSSKLEDETSNKINNPIQTVGIMFDESMDEEALMLIRSGNYIEREIDVNWLKRATENNWITVDETSMALTDNGLNKLKELLSQ